MKKILIVNKMYSPDIGGVETVVKQYAEYLAKMYDVTVLVGNSKLSIRTRYETLNNVKIIRCSSFGIFFSMPISVPLFLHLILRRNNYDVVHFHEPFPIASVISLFKKKNKYIVTWHSDVIKQKVLKKIVTIFQKLLCRKADVILTTSPQMVESSCVLSDFKDKIEVVPLSIAEEKYHEQPVSPGDFYLYIGRISYYKGIIHLIDSFELSNTKYPLYIVGNGSKRLVDEINNKISKSRKKIIFINKYVTDQEKRDFLSRSRALLFPSIYPSEAFGIIQLEAMIYQKPVINTSLDTGVPWVSLNRVTGITVEPENIQELANAITSLDSDDLVEEYGVSAKKRVLEIFNDSTVLEKLNTIYLKQF
ncbi:glycosyltransferase [Citrobacter freundii]|uniref:glycosyltransferase n=1 Tax=Citrobacter freundii TaxID=546 RepID=UPI002DBA1176|nr:glycosyltransferase [Citrobacter freundii]MEB6425298.1 glycosyltransferase [Citrobacter freundii]